MKGYKGFIIVFTAMLAIYILAEINRPEEVNWNVSLSSKDKNPFGAFILYQQLKTIFPKAGINSYHLPIYNQLTHFEEVNTAYILIEPECNLNPEDMEALLNYVVAGNYVFMASASFGKLLMDSLRFSLKSSAKLIDRDSTTINFNNPALHAAKNYSYHRMTLDTYFKKFDTANTIVLGTNQRNNVNFIKMPYGEGAFFIHALPLCFSNDFMLTGNNTDYTAKALSYLPNEIHTLFWDEYYKQEEHGKDTPLRFVLSNTWLRIAFRTGLLTIFLFVLFEAKRRQRAIPVIVPLQNSTLDFVKTVGNLYFNQRDNHNIALKKVSYFLESIRSGFNISTNYLNEEFIIALSKKTALPEEEISALVKLIEVIQHETKTSDQQLLELNRQIDYFNARRKE